MAACRQAGLSSTNRMNSGVQLFIKSIELIMDQLSQLLNCLYLRQVTG
jgi:hypothetical protein